MNDNADAPATRLGDGGGYVSAFEKVKYDNTPTQPAGPIQSVDRGRFAAAFGKMMRSADGQPRKRGLVVAVVVAVVVFAAGAVGIGALTSQKTVSAVTVAQRTGARPSPASASLGRRGHETAAERGHATSPAAGVPWATAGPPPAPTGGPTSGPAKGTAHSSGQGAPVPAAGTTSTSSSSGAPGKSASSSAPAPAPSSSAPAPAPSSSATGEEVTGQVDCESGNPVEGFWVSSASQSGWASWQYATGTNADYWYWLPTAQSYHINIGCGGTSTSWAVATTTPQVSGVHNSFHCNDIAGTSGYGQCVLR